MKTIERKYLIIAIIILVSTNIISIAKYYNISKEMNKYKEYIVKEIEASLSVISSSIHKSKVTIETVLENNYITQEQFNILRDHTYFISFNYKKLKIMSDAFGYDSFNSDCKLINENVYSYFDFYLSKEIKDRSSYTLTKEEHSLLSNIAQLLNTWGSGFYNFIS